MARVRWGCSVRVAKGDSTVQVGHHFQSFKWIHYRFGQLLISVNLTLLTGLFRDWLQPHIAADPRVDQASGLIQPTAQVEAEGMLAIELQNIPIFNLTRQHLNSPVTFSLPRCLSLCFSLSLPPSLSPSLPLSFSIPLSLPSLYFPLSLTHTL